MKHALSLTAKTMRRMREEFADVIYALHDVRLTTPLLPRTCRSLQIVTVGRVSWLLRKFLGLEPCVPV